jgi:Tfp pilus assembly protein PilF
MIQKEELEDLVTQERNKMKKYLFFILTAVMLIVLSFGCSRRINPSLIDENQGLKYDSAAFDYSFVEALRQKFLGNAGDALRYFEQCVKMNPKSDAAYFELAQIALMLSDNTSAKKFGLRAVSINEKNIWYLTLLANIYYQEKKVDSTIIYYEKAIKYFPERDNVRLSLAGIYSEDGQSGKADEIYYYFEKKYGVNEATSLSIIKNKLNIKDYKGAELKVNELLAKEPENILYNGLLAEIYRSSGEKEKAISVYRKLVDNDPGNPKTLLSLSDFLINEKQYEDLFPVLNQIVINDSISREDKISLFTKIISDSSILKTRGNDVELALIVLEADNTKDGIIILLRPEFYINQGDLKKAISRLEEIINEQPDNYYAWERCLLLYSETKDWNKLMIKGEECATKFNRSFVAKVLYASAAMEKEKYSLAEEELRKSKILAGNDTDKVIQVLVMNADLFYRKKEFLKSFETFKEALKIKPDDAMILNNYAYYLAEQGQELKEAERMAKIVIEKEKGNTTYLDTYAWVLYKRGRYKESEKIMENIISSTDKEDAEWYEHFGYIMKAQKKCDKAIEYWKTAYKLDERKSSLLNEIKNCGKH